MAETKNLSDKKVSELTEDELLDIVIDWNDSEMLTWTKWQNVLKESFVLHNYLSDAGMVKWLKMLRDELVESRRNDEEAERIVEAIKIYEKEE